MILLTSLAVLPGLVIIAKVYSMDKIEKEPVGLLLLLLLLGGIICFPVASIESVFVNILNAIIPHGTLYNVIENFLCVALIEELGKYFVLKLTTWRNRNFDYRFDAIVYAVSASLGFAVLENIFYVWDGGIQVAIMRAVLSVPGHAMFGLFMGVSYGFAKSAEKRGNIALCKRELKLAVIVPTILHGIYDFCLSQGTYLSVGFFYVFVIIMYIVAWKRLKKGSMTDEQL